MLDARHFNNHISFLVGLVSLYLLTVRLAGRRAALGAFALMATQPLLMGHSFINQKDTPFMALFLASVAAGVLCSSSSTGTRISASSRVRSVSALARASWRAARQDWRSATRRRRTLFACVVLAAVAVSGGVLLVYPTLPLAVQLIILRAHAGESSTWINALFDLIAANAAQVAAWSYVGKAARIYARLRPLIVVLAWIPAFFAGRMVFPSLRLPGNLRFPWTGMGKPRLGLAVALGAAGALLGVTISVRSLGVFAGVLVTLLLLLEKRPPLVGILVYWAAAALACFGTWPYLWDDPIGGFVDSLRVMAAFPWEGIILYAGQVWYAGATPWHYLPFLIAAQVTLPAILLAVPGVVVILRRAHSWDMHWGLGALLFFWMSVPIVTAVALQSVVYDNTRQFLFALPPLFIFAGIGLEWLWTRCRPRVMGAAVVTALLAPGVLGVLTLHPYEYTYFNALVGGTQGAFRRYETDYWCTSYREAMEQINAVAPTGGVVAVSGPSVTAKQDARADLVIRQMDDGTDPVADRVDFGLACTRSNSDEGFYPRYAVTGEVTAGGATLAVIKDFRQPQP